MLVLGGEGGGGGAVQAGGDDFDVDFVSGPEKIAGVCVCGLRRPRDNAARPRHAALPHPAPDAQLVVPGANASSLLKA
jgi:hypothetical protein